MAHLTKPNIGLLAFLLLSFGSAAQYTAPVPPPDAASGEDATSLAKKLQNPVGDLHSFPFERNTNFNTGPHQGTQDILNVQPVIAIHINDDWNVITRTILPLVWQPSFQPAQTVPFGTAPIIDANWLPAGDNVWTLPLGGNVGRVVKIGGKLPVNFSVGVYYNALRPEYGSTWQLQT